MAIPDFIGKYEIRRELGKGAMGAVYEGFDPVIKRSVAIKTILAGYLANVESEAAVARFKQEAQAGGRLQHPGIVGVYEYGEDETGAYIVMEYVQGKLLRQCMRERGRFEPIDVFEVMKQLLAALDYSHQHDVVHRDIKPTNVMVLGGMKIKIMDFGVAKIENSSLTQVGTVIGTPTHISPEQLLGLPADHRADLWSAGVILYEMLIGIQPYKADTPLGLALKHITEPIPHILEANPNLPVWMEKVISTAMAKDRDDRFATAVEMIETIKAFMRGEDPTRQKTQKIGTTQKVAPFNKTAIGKKQKNSRNPLPIMIITGLFLVVVVGAGAVYFMGREKPESTVEAPIATSTSVPPTAITIAPIDSTATSQVIETIAPTETQVAAPKLPVIGGADKIAFLRNNDIYIMNSVFIYHTTNRIPNGA